ncbi:undecaprenyl-diphosphate phosphatase [Gaoshiqia sediminis]|uniref:Undecaprenyl-diphosphatase n=1 Tax=Gaoshiqia sediminis TaxID=2986998 RepID=A0AA42CAS4_9BACT|nr:undecaprenyl-diphosphate phosphatase [Gaoshiqia sediminis]MCW0484202.1 undecaprenyl-diphosphate phosphatase [Gaoshiqia sediminis]
MLWELIKAIILGIVEGLTEFLPVSSTGHLILVNQWLSYSDEFTVLFDVFIQLGAILAVIIYFRNEIFPPNPAHMIKKEFLLFWSKILTAFVPAVICGLLFASFIEERLFNVLTVSISLFAGGVLLILLDRKERTGKVFSVQEMSYQTALYIGLFQCLAMVPGTSRSAATIIGALVLGCSRKLAAEFSFYLAIPTILAASVYSLAKSQAHFNLNNFLILATGFIVTFFVAMAVIKFLMSFIKKHSFVAFGYYRIALAIIFFVWLYHQ